MYGQVADMPSSGTLRSQPPKTGSQYPMRRCRSATGRLREQVIGEIDVRVKANDLGCVSDKVRERVDVVEVELAIAVIDDVFDPADVDAHALDDAFDGRPQVGRRVIPVDPQAGLRRFDHAGAVERDAGARLADVGRAEVKRVAG